MTAGNDAGPFAGHAAVVTGAAGEIGAAICAELAAAGARVWAADRRPVSGSAGCTPVVLDVTDADAVTAAFTRIAAEDPITILVNAAGGPGTVRTPVEEVTDDAWRSVTRLNLDGAFHCARAAVPSMKRGGGGAIVNISSGAGRTYSRTGVQAYAAAKAGVIGLTRQLARELGPHAIRVNCVAPGLIMAEPTRPEWEAMSPDERDRHLAGVALGRLGTAGDVAGPVLFFCSSAARYVTGQTISADGGGVMLG